MTNHDWIELFRMIPKDQQNTLVLTTLSGMDLAIEQVLRTELSFLVFRGRVVGNTDEGRVFFLPYRQIDFLQINRVVKEVEVRELFGEKPAETNGAPPSSSGSYTTITASSGTFPQAAPVVSAPAVVAAGPMPTSVRPAAPPPVRMPPGIASSPSIAARLSNIPTAALQPPPPPIRMPNVPAAALVPPGGVGSGDQPAPPRNSILERLRAQRNSILPPRPPVR
ncbi:MAG: hypothetical protein U0746_02440 [Gemmataceae bacterium]